LTELLLGTQFGAVLGHDPARRTFETLYNNPIFDIDVFAIAVGETQQQTGQNTIGTCTTPLSVKETPKDILLLLLKV
jgi:hypothetical protein